MLENWDINYDERTLGKKTDVLIRIQRSFSGSSS